MAPKPGKARRRRRKRRPVDTARTRAALAKGRAQHRQGRCERAFNPCESAPHNNEHLVLARQLRVATDRAHRDQSGLFAAAVKSLQASTRLVRRASHHILQNHIHSGQSQKPESRAHPRSHVPPTVPANPGRRRRRHVRTPRPSMRQPARTHRHHPPPAHHRLLAGRGLLLEHGASGKNAGLEWLGAQPTGSVQALLHWAQHGHPGARVDGAVVGEVKVETLLIGFEQWGRYRAFRHSILAHVSYNVTPGKALGVRPDPFE